MGENMEYKEYEDITSTSKREDFVDISSMSRNSKSKHYKRKKRGIAGFFSRIGTRISKWWKKASKLQKTAVISLSSVLALFLTVIILLSTVFNYNYNSITKNPEELGFEGVIDENIINIALFGIDTRSKDFKGNSDSIMILSLNTKSKQVKIVSILRDSFVKIVKNGKTTYNKINSAYASGGPELAIKTINENFGLDISEYATVNFEGMVDIIDAVGGIDAELTKGEVVPASKNVYLLNGLINDICSRTKLDPEKYYIHTSGNHHLNGVQAVAYSRIRKTANIWGTNNDQGRTDRQRYVMEQLFNKALTLKKSDYMSLAKALIPCSETSLSYTQIISLATSILLKSPTFSQSRVPLEDYQITSNVPNIKSVGSIVYYDLEYASELLHAYFYDDIEPEQYIETNGVRKNNWYKGVTSGSSGGSTSSKSPATSSSSSVTSSTTSSNVSSATASEESKPEDNGDKDDDKTDDDKKENQSSSETTGGSKPSSSEEEPTSSNIASSDGSSSSSDSGTSSNQGSANEE